jgi:hypothetical protein
VAQEVYDGQDFRKVEWGLLMVGVPKKCLIKKRLQRAILDSYNVLYITTMVYCYVPMTKISRN